MGGAIYDLELALTDSSGLTTSVIEKLRAEFVLDDRSKQGWGLVLRLPQSEGSSLDKLLQQFLSVAMNFKSVIKNSKPILRVAAFNPNVTCTLFFKDIEQLAELGVQLETSVYPTES